MQLIFSDPMSESGKTGLVFYQMKVEPAVVKIDFTVTVTGAQVKIHNIDSYGAKAFFFLSFDDEPPFNLVDSVIDGSDYDFWEQTFSIPGEYSVTGDIHCNKSL